MPADWFAQNAPQQSNSDWFAQNAPSATNYLSPQNLAASKAANAQPTQFERTAVPDAYAQQHPYLSSATNAITDLASGFGAGASQIPLTVAKALNARSSIVQPLERAATPDNTTQKVGAGLEQAAELAMMGGPARTAATKAGLGVLGRIGAAGATTALSSALHGQDVKTGAGIGAATEGLGELAKVIAPKLAEAALGTRFSERMYGRNPGAAILNSTTGVTPDAVAKSAKDVSLQMVSDLEKSANAAAQRGVTVSTKPALDVIDNAITTASKENNGALVGQLQEARKQLTEQFDTGAAIPQNISPTQLLNLKRGFGDTVTNWGKLPDRQGVSGVLKQAYRALDSEFDRVVPEAAQANQTISTLIGVSRDAQRRAVMPSVTQAVAQRAMAHTGALAAAAAGGYGGYQRGGTEGAVVGGLAGLLLPELASRPTSLMMAARAAHTAQPAISAGLPALVQQMMSKSH